MHVSLDDDYLCLWWWQGRVHGVTFDGFISWHLASKYSSSLYWHQPLLTLTSSSHNREPVAAWRRLARVALFIFICLLFTRGRRLNQVPRPPPGNGRALAVTRLACILSPIRPLASAINTTKRYTAQQGERQPRLRGRIILRDKRPLTTSRPSSPASEPALTDLNIASCRVEAGRGRLGSAGGLEHGASNICQHGPGSVAP